MGASMCVAVFHGCCGVLAFRATHFQQLTQATVTPFYALDVWHSFPVCGDQTQCMASIPFLY